MKNKIFLYLLFFLFSFSTLQAEKDIFNFSLRETTVKFQNNEWKSVYNNDGLIIYLKEEVLPEGRFIAYKYENSTSKEISFSLELMKNNKSVSNKMEINLKENSSKIFFDPTDTIQLNGSESIDDYTVKIN